MGVSETIRSDVSNLMKDIPNFVKDVPRVPKCVPRWGSTLNEIMDHPCSNGGPGSDRIRHTKFKEGCTKFNEECTKFCEGCTKGLKVCSEVGIEP